jgi:hypothetical protein
MELQTFTVTTKVTPFASAFRNASLAEVRSELFKRARAEEEKGAATALKPPDHYHFCSVSEEAELIELYEHDKKLSELRLFAPSPFLQLVENTFTSARDQLTKVKINAKLRRRLIWF